MPHNKADMVDEESDLNFSSTESSAASSPAALPAQEDLLPAGPPPTKEELDEFYKPVYDRAREKRIHDMKEPLTASWDVPITDADASKLRAGFKSRCDMDQKWDFLVQDPDPRGGWSVHIIRNWAYDDCYVLHVVPNKPTDDRGATGAVIEAVTWDGNMTGFSVPEEQAKLEAVLLCRNWLEVEIAALPEYSWDLFRQNHTKIDAAE